MASIVGGLLGPWESWVLGGTWRTAWTWLLRFAAYGGDGVDHMSAPTSSGWPRWRRLALSAYWLGVIFLAVGGWQTRLVRARRIRRARGLDAAGAAREMGVEGAREERRMHVSLDLRRKFFHALAIIMFVPGIALDPAFSSLAFSVAFAVFAFAEYIRYFALYPLGAPMHRFFTEFVDSDKDAGPVILSHFYLVRPTWPRAELIRAADGMRGRAVARGRRHSTLLGRARARHRRRHGEPARSTDRRTTLAWHAEDARRDRCVRDVAHRRRLRALPLRTRGAVSGALDSARAS